MEAQKRLKGGETPLTESLVNTGMCNTDRKHISQITEGDEDGESMRTSTVAKDVAEEEINNNLRVGEIAGDCVEVSNISKNTQDYYTTDSDGRGNLEDPTGTLGLSGDVVSVLPSKVY